MTASAESAGHYHEVAAELRAPTRALRQAVRAAWAG